MGHPIPICPNSKISFNIEDSGNALYFKIPAKVTRFGPSGENSSLIIRGERKKASITKRIKFAIGQIWVKVNKQKAGFTVETPSGIAAVKGTEFYCLVDEEGNTMVIGIKGIISLMNDLGEILIKAGETGLATKLSAPTVQQTDGSQIPDWIQGDDMEKYLEFEFQDGEGNKKNLKINYQNK